jgi:hypothetical protein
MKRKCLRSSNNDQDSDGDSSTAGDTNSNPYNFASDSLWSTDNQQDSSSTVSDGDNQCQMIVKSTICSLRSTIDSIKKKEPFDYKSCEVHKSYKHGPPEMRLTEIEALEEKILDAITLEKQFRILKKKNDYKQEQLCIIQENKAALNKTAEQNGSAVNSLRMKILEDLEATTITELLQARENVHCSTEILFRRFRLQGHCGFNDTYDVPDRKVKKFAMMQLYPFNDIQIKNIFGEDEPVPAGLEDYYQKKLFRQKVELNMQCC